MSKDLDPRGEGLRSAVRWLAEHAPVATDTITEAAQRFDLPPLEAEFLLGPSIGSE